ncbi:MAG: hypothetical protein P8169_12960, partial [Chloroflexota bacterium]
MQREVDIVNFNVVVLLQPFNTPGTEIAPGSNEVRINIERHSFRHKMIPVFVIVYNLISNAAALKSEIPFRAPGGVRGLLTPVVISYRFSETCTLCWSGYYAIQFWWEWGEQWSFKIKTKSVSLSKECY